MGDSLAVADSLRNLRLTYDFCRSHLDASLLTLTVADLFHGSEALRLNVLSFLADLFRCFEVEKASCVRDTGRPFAFETDAAETKLQKSQGRLSFDSIVVNFVVFLINVDKLCCKYALTHTAVDLI